MRATTNRIFVVVALTASMVGFSLRPAAAQNFLNVGVRIGVKLGGGLTVGGELSYGAWRGAFAGVAAGIDYTFAGGFRDNILRLYADLEGGLIAVGMAFGGSVLFTDGRLRLGRQGSIFAGWPVDTADPDRWTLMMAYYRALKITGDSHTVKDIGLFFKSSYPVGEGNYDFSLE
ncbi:MAG: hypothetical protein ACE5HO_18060 [bacterium]